MLTDEDKALWEAYTKTVTPLKKKSRLKSFGQRIVLKFHLKRKTDVPTTLDLHGFALQEAYNLFLRFLTYHFEHGTKRVVVITGKGKDGAGLLKNEFPKWLESDIIKEKIKASGQTLLNGGGAFELMLKQRKE